MCVSLPSRGAWIEIPQFLIAGIFALESLPSRGAWIEICKFTVYVNLRWCRSPHGERGLKLLIILICSNVCKSLPSRGAWIEMMSRGTPAQPHSCRSPHGERGLK